MASVDSDNSEIIADRLLGEFQSLGRLGFQTQEGLERILGKDSGVTRLLLASRDLALESMRGELQRGTIDPSNSGLIEYLMASMGALQIETLRVLFLDAARTLIADEQMQHGTTGRVALYPRAIFRRAIELDAACIILVHNHPSGNPEPSESDRLVTDILVRMGRSLDITVLEHIIVTSSRHHRMLGGEPRPKAKPGGMIDLRDGRAAERPSNDSMRAAAVANARRTLHRRRLRRRLLGAGQLFGEPAWDALVDLFIHECEGKAVSTSSLCIASGLRMSSALRLLRRLSDARFIVREPDPHDGRRIFIRLTPETSRTLSAYFVAGDE